MFVSFFWLRSLPPAGPLQSGVEPLQLLMEARHERGGAQQLAGYRRLFRFTGDGAQGARRYGGRGSLERVRLHSGTRPIAFFQPLPEAAQLERRLA